MIWPLKFLTVVCLFLSVPYEQSHAEEFHREQRILKEIFESVYGCLEDCTGSPELTFASANDGVKSLYTELDRLKTAVDANNFSYLLNFKVPMSPTGPDPLAYYVSKLGGDLKEKLQGQLRTQVFPRVKKLLAGVDRSSSVDLKIQSLQVVYYLRILTASLIPENELIVDFGHINEEIAELKTDETAESLEFAFVLKKVCDVYSNVRCEHVNGIVLEKMKERIASLQDASELIKFSIDFSKTFNLWIHPLPGNYFFTAHDTKVTAMNLLSLEASYKCHGFFSGKMFRLGENCPVSSSPEDYRWPDDLGLTFFVLHAFDHTNVASSTLSDVYFLIRDRFYEIYSNEKDKWPRFQNEIVYLWSKIMKIDLDSLSQGGSGVADDIGDGLRFFRDNGVSLKSLGELAGVVIEKSTGGEVSTIDLNALRFDEVAKLPGDVSILKISTTEIVDKPTIGIVYQLNQKSGIVDFEMALDPQVGSNIFSQNKDRTIFSGMGIMANESYTGPAWATGSSVEILSQFWNPQRDGLLIIRAESPKLQILHSSEYVENLEKRTGLYEDLGSGVVRFFSLGQLFLYEGKNLVSKPTSDNIPCLGRNILATNSSTGSVTYFKLFCATAYDAVEVVKKLGMTEAFNLDAFLGNYDYHVRLDGTEFGTPGLGSSSYSRFNAILNQSIDFPPIRSSKVCKKRHFECPLDEYFSRYPDVTLDED